MTLMSVTTAPGAQPPASSDPSSAPGAAGDVDAGAGAGGGSAAAATATALPPDEELVELLRNGSPAAGDVLVKRYYQPLMRYLLRISGGEHPAEELHQQTWLSVLDHLDKFDRSSAAGGFKSWLFRIATNKAHDYWRMSGRERSAKDGLRLVIDREAPPAGQRLEASEQEQKLLSAIEKLPEAQRQVLMLRYYGGLKFVEIAELIGCPLNTALGRMHKAMMRLKQLMET
jgi:RNA polymerase sigma-70 factor, ECF subfamily